MGSINLNNTGSGSAVTLSSDGSSLLLNGSAIGGGGDPDLYAANESSPTAQPSAVGANAIGIGNNVDAGTSSSHANAIALGGSGTASQPIRSSNTHAVAIGTAYSGAVTASGEASMAIGTGATVASGGHSLALGRNSTASATDAVAFTGSLASGQKSFAAALTSNSSTYGAQGAYSVALGERSKATGYGSVALGYGTATADASFACISGTASATNAFAFGSGAQATANPSIAMGYQPEARAGASVSMGFRTKVISTGNGSTAFGIDSSAAIASKQVFGGRKFSADGDCQSGTTVLKAVTTNATATPFFCGYLGSPGTSIVNKFVMPNNSAYAFHGTIVARQKASEGSACAAWKVEGLIRREANAGTTVLVNSATTVIDNTPSWVMALSADTTNSTNGGGLAITGTGASSTNIRWVATIHTSEITYA